MSMKSMKFITALFLLLMLTFFWQCEHRITGTDEHEPVVTLDIRYVDHINLDGPLKGMLEPYGLAKKEPLSETQGFDEVRALVFDLNRSTEEDFIDEDAFEQGLTNLFENQTLYRWTSWRDFLKEHIPLISESKLDVDYENWIAKGEVKGVEGLNWILIAFIQSDSIYYFGDGSVWAEAGEKAESVIEVGPTDYWESNYNTTPTELSLTSESATVTAGDFLQLTCTAYYADNSSEDITLDVTWSVVPSEAGYVNIIGEFESSASYVGTATITAAYQGLTVETQVTVQDASTHAPDAPTLSQPADGSSMASQTMTYEWSEISNVFAYQIQVSVMNDFSATVMDELSYFSNYTGSALDIGTYYWRVRAQDDTYGEWGAWSDVWQFTIY